MNYQNSRTIVWWHTVILGAILLSTSLSSASERSKADFYVSTVGSDTWSGKLAAPNADRSDGPFATLTRARDTVRELKKNDLEKPITVMVREGKYYLGETLVLTAEDSGTSDCPITYTAYPGEKPIMSGGRKITGWKPYKGKILQCELPEARTGKWKFRQLFLNNQRQIRARYPNFDPDNPLYGGWAYMIDWFVEEDKYTTFSYKSGIFKRHWAKPTEGEINFFYGPGGGRWASYQDIFPIMNIHEEECHITLAHNMSEYYIPYGEIYPAAGNRFIVENILEELDQPGEWCLDSGEGMVYFWPPGGLLEGAEVTVPALARLIECKEVSWLTISGLTFTETSEISKSFGFRRQSLPDLGFYPYDHPKHSALYLTGTTQICIENNHFSAVGGNAICLEGHNSRNLIQYNEIGYAGARGVYVLGSSEEEYPLFNQILDNHIHNGGAITKYIGYGVDLSKFTSGNLVAHNKIYHMSRCGIGAWGGFGRNIIEYNEIRFACTEIHDTGAINTAMGFRKGRRVEERCGHIFRYNLIADTKQAPSISVDENGKISMGYGDGWAIDMDDGSSNCFVYGNIIVRAGHGMTVHAGKNNIIENNIFVDCMTGQMHWHGNTSKPWPGAFRGNHFCRNIFYATKPEAFLYSLDVQGELTEAIEQSDYNLFFNAADGKYPIRWSTLSLADWQKMGLERHSVIADPLFVDPANDDYRLKPESPALELGFQPIDQTKIGPRKTAPER